MTEIFELCQGGWGNLVGQLVNNPQLSLGEIYGLLLSCQALSKACHKKLVLINLDSH